MIDCIDGNGDGNRDGSQRSLILRPTRVMQVSIGHRFAVNADILPPSAQSSLIILELYVVSDFHQRPSGWWIATTADGTHHQSLPGCWRVVQSFYLM